MIRYLGQIFFLFVLAVPLSSYAHQPKRGKVIGTWGPIFFSRYNDREYNEVSNPLGAGFMIAGEGDVDKNGGLEIVLGYMKVRYFRKEGGSVLIEDAKRVHTSTGYRHWFTPQWSAAIALFTAYSIGDVRTIESKLAPGAEIFTTAASRTAEDGLDFSLQHEFISTKKNAILVDFRYSYSFSARGNESPGLYGIGISFKHFIQAREPNQNLTTP